MKRTSKTLLIAISCFFCSASQAEDIGMLKMDFSTLEQAKKWRAVNDGVMGGQSSGDSHFEGGNLVFKGVINTNGGGFSSIRAPIDRGVFTNVSALKLRVKSDGRQYRLTVRTNATYRGREVAFQAAIPKTDASVWTDVTIALTDMEASLFGRSVTGVAFNKDKIRSIGIIIADGQDGAFQIELAAIEGI